ncbi:hypothetical protein BJV74DRAFT_954723 [Russula compacta]|nr:hypothetical protein BJV74DRAFT_954723 [Russula compacta]
MTPSDHQDTPPNTPPNIPPNAGAVIVTRVIDTVVRQLPAAQESQGDQKLELARELAVEYESVIGQHDRRIIEERIAHARDMKVGLDGKRSFQKLLQAREYRRAANDAFRYAKHASDRGRDAAHFSHLSDRDDYERVKRVAQHLYWSYLSCRDAFPLPHTAEEWAATAWSEACAFTGENPTAFPEVEEVLTSSMTFLNDMKMRIMHAVETSYGFDTSQASHSISSNATCAQALLAKTTFIYRELNFDGTSHFPYRHPVIQKAVNLTWFQNKDSDGIVFYGHFTPIPIKAMALILTVIECCIYEWSDGTRRECNWNEERYKTTYHSHVRSICKLRDHSPPHSTELVQQIQSDLLKDARTHAGAAPEPITEEGRFTLEDLDSALQDELPGYYDNVPMIRISASDDP